MSSFSALITEDSDDSASISDSNINDEKIEEERPNNIPEKPLMVDNNDFYNPVNIELDKTWETTKKK